MLKNHKLDHVVVIMKHIIVKKYSLIRIILSERHDSALVIERKWQRLQPENEKLDTKLSFSR